MVVGRGRSTERPREVLTALKDRIAHRLQSAGESAAFDRLLIVDDSREVRILLRALFTGDFARIDEAADGEAAVRLLSTSVYSAVVLDLLMPVAGTVLLDYALEHDPAILPRIVVVTAAAGDLDLLTGVRSAAVAAVIPKPFDTGELLAVVKSVAAGQQKRVGGAPSEQYLQ